MRKTLLGARLLLGALLFLAALGSHVVSSGAVQPITMTDLNSTTTSVAR
ncbi:MAG TPA: hypothetical protein VLN59_01025 [Burkholderiales bacterium]|nr:hypothetical protein [Burkholderiales bacterium]